MRAWKLCIRDEEGFDENQGYALARTEIEARELVGQAPYLHVFEKRVEMQWPGRSGTRIVWN